MNKFTIFIILGVILASLNWADGVKIDMKNENKETTQFWWIIRRAI